MTTDGLNSVVIRLPVVYGPGDHGGIMPRAACAATYIESQEKMQFLWDKHTRVNTVHVEDVARAVWHLAQQEPQDSSELFNLADKSDTSQGSINAFLGSIFSIRTGFHGKIVSNLAKMRMKESCAVANEMHLTPWMSLCSQHGCANTLRATDERSGMSFP